MTPTQSSLADEMLGALVAQRWLYALTAHELAVLVVMMTSADADGVSQVRLFEIAERAGYSNTRDLDHARNRLIDLGLLVRVGSGDTKERNGHRLIVPRRSPSVVKLAAWRGR
jgi:hypothetical protein